MASLSKLAAMRTLLVALLAASFGLAGTPGHGEPSPGDPPSARMATVAAAFEENLGQAGVATAFLWRGEGGITHITRDGAVSSGGASGPVGMRFLGASPATVQGSHPLPGVSSYFRGNDPARWVRGARHFERVRIQQMYPGIDVVWRTAVDGRLEYDLIIEPGAEPSQVRIAFDGAVPALGADGSLILGEGLRHRPPVAFQDIAGTRRRVASAYALRDGLVSLHLGPYDRLSTLVVDPVLEYSTYVGGSLSDWGMAIAAAPDGDAVMAGYTQSLVIPGQVTGFGQRYVTDVLVTRIAADGSLVYNVFLGGDEPPNAVGVKLTCSNPAYWTVLVQGCGEELAFSVALDAGGSAFVAGYTTSRAFPIVNPAQPAYGGGGSDGFISKIDPTGRELLASTYLGGSNAEEVRALTVDTDGRALAAGATSSSDFPTAQPLQPSLTGPSDAFVTRLSRDGGALEWSTYLGGTGAEMVDGVAAGRAAGGDHGYTLTGWTSSADFPLLGAIQPDFAGGQGGELSSCPCDAFLTRIATGGDRLLYSTYLGGAENDYGRDVVVGADGRAHAVGYTLSTDFPTSRPFQAQRGGGADGFVASLSPDGADLEFATYLGGELPEDAGGIALDPCGSLYVAGYTPSPDFPTLRSLQGPNPGSTKTQNDAFLAKFDGDRRLVYATLLGGATFDGAYAVAVDEHGGAMLAGFTGSDNFPTARAQQPIFGGQTDATMARISDEPCGMGEGQP